MAIQKTPVARETTIAAPAGIAPSAETSLQIEAPAADAPRKVLHEGGVAVWMPMHRAGGVRQFGVMLPGTVYIVDPAEALRLVTVKGFRFASSADQVAISNHVDGIADALATTPQE